jgi:hypothetical protein
MELIEAQLILDEQIDQHAESNANAQSERVDKGVKLPFLNIPGCHIQVIANHYCIIDVPAKFVPQHNSRSAKPEHIPDKPSSSTLISRRFNIHVKPFQQITVNALIQFRRTKPSQEPDRQS